MADTYNQTVRELLAPFAVGVAPNGTGRVITWESVVGRSYQVQFKDSLTTGWQNLGASVTANALAVIQTDSSPTPTRFYRILRTD